jgi:hypothetical protein
MNFVTVLIALVMFIALIGMIVCSKKQKTSPIAQPIAIGLLIVVIACGIGILYETDILGSASNRYQEYENRYHSAQGFVLGKYIQENFPGQKVLVLLETDYATNPRTKILTDGLKAGAGSNLDIETDTLVLPGRSGGSEMEPGMEMPLFEMMTAADFDKALTTHKDCGVVISSIGLPRDAAKMKLWSQKDRPKVLLLNAFDMRNYDNLLNHDMINAIVAIGPEAKFTEDAPPRDPQAAFGVRYVLIDKKNVGEYERLFR